MDIEQIKKELKDKKDKVAFLKEQLVSSVTSKSEIRTLLMDTFRSEKSVKVGVFKHPLRYRLVYDSFGEGLEPIYFWILDHMRDKYNGLGLDVSKTAEDFEASVGSGYFAEIGARATRMQEQAMKMLGAINQVVKSIVNLLYDLKEFEERLTMYEKSHSKNKNEADAAVLGLKQLWMDNVDLKRGRGSINQLTQQLQFVTLRDAFMAAKNEDDVEKIDLNERVKRILKPRIQEFNEWRGRSEKELQKRYNIEKSYVKSQLGSLKIYALWTKPYLKAAQRLGMKDFSSPDIVPVFENMQIELALFGKREIEPASVFEEYKKLGIKKKYYSCVEVRFKFRTVPQAVRSAQGSHYVHGGRTEVVFIPMVLTDDDMNYLKEQEMLEGLDLIEDMVDAPLRELREDIEKYLKGEEEEKKEKKRPKRENIVLSTFKGFKDVLGAFKDLFGLRESRETITFQEKQIIKSAEDSAKGNAFNVYDIYKKAHGMPTW